MVPLIRFTLLLIHMGNDVIYVDEEGLGRQATGYCPADAFNQTPRLELARSLTRLLSA